MRKQTLAGSMQAAAVAAGAGNSVAQRVADDLNGVQRHADRIPPPQAAAVRQLS